MERPSDLIILRCKAANAASLAGCLAEEAEGYEIKARLMAPDSDWGLDDCRGSSRNYEDLPDNWMDIAEMDLSDSLATPEPEIPAATITTNQSGSGGHLLAPALFSHWLDAELARVEEMLRAVKAGDCPPYEAVAVCALLVRGADRFGTEDQQSRAAQLDGRAALLTCV